MQSHNPVYPLNPYLNITINPNHNHSVTIFTITTAYPHLTLGGRVPTSHHNLGHPDTLLVLTMAHWMWTLTSLRRHIVQRADFPGALDIIQGFIERFG